MKNVRYILSTCILVIAVGCDVGAVNAVGSDLAPPSDLAAAAAGTGVHLTWRDNSPDETSFMVMRMMHGSTDETEHLATLAANATDYHDTSVESGMTYMYTVVAISDAGEAESGPIEFVAP